MRAVRARSWRPANARSSRTVVAAFAAAFVVISAGVFQTPSAAADPSPVTVTVVLQAHDNSVLDILGNGSASYYAGGWHQMTTQNPNNHAMLQTQLEPGTYSFAVVYNGTRDQKTVTVGSGGATVYFHAALVRVALQSHTNDFLDIPNDGSASYYAGGWHPVTTLDPNDHRLVQAEMLPGNYSFAATYNGTRDQKTQTIIEPNPNNGANSVQGVYFHAALVNVELQAHDNSILDIPNNGSASYYAGGWHSITTVNANNHSIVQTEMLPGTYSFAVLYNGTRDQKAYTVIEPNPNNHANANQIVYFHAALVNVMLQAHDNSALDIPANGSASYYAGGWHAITTLNVNNPRLVQAEMLPGTYSFAAVYQGTRDQTTYTVIEPNPNNHANANQTVYFHAALVFVELQAHDNSILDIPGNGSASYYAGGWHSITTQDPNNHSIVQTEMLPGTYSFAAVYQGTRDQKTYTVIEPNPNNHANANQVVYFHTVQVISDHGSATGYYAQGWQPFASGDELLPGTYTFRFDDGTANTSYALSGSTFHIH